MLANQPKGVPWSQNTLNDTYLKTFPEKCCTRSDGDISARRIIIPASASLALEDAFFQKNTFSSIKYFSTNTIQNCPLHISITSQETLLH